MSSPDLSGWLLTYLVHSTLLLVAASLLAPRFRSHRIRETLWKTALFGGFLTATGQTLLQVSPLAGRMTVAAPTAVAQQQRAAKLGQQKTEKAAEFAENTDAAESSSPSSSAVASEKSAAAFASVNPERLLVWSWGIVAVFLLAVYLVRRVRFARRIVARRNVTEPPLAPMLEELRGAAGIARRIRLTASPVLGSPVALGPSEIAVPEAALTDLDPGQQRSMLAHELAHLDRRDPAWLTAACLAEQIFFFQPLNRLARRRIQESAEYLCDEWAVRRTGSGVLLAKCLAKVAEWLETSPRSVPVAGMAEDRSHLIARVRRLLDGAPFPVAPGRRTLVIASLAIITLTLVALPGVSLARHQQPAADPTLSAESTRGSEPVTGSAGVLGSRAPRGGTTPALSGPRTTPPAEPPALANPPAEDPPVGAAEPAAQDLPAQETIDTGRIVQALIGALKDANVEVRRAAVRSIANFEDRSAIPALREALRDADAEVRAHAIEALGDLHDAASADAIAALIKDPNRDVRSHAIEALTDLELTEAPAGLLEALRDSDPEVRHQAVHAVGHFQDARAVPMLRILLDDPKADVREAAVEALGEIRNEAAIQALIVALKAKDPKVRQAAADALGKR
jgi:beta-lactamase regulating signal transducer with metallopeptidase domain